MKSRFQWWIAVFFVVLAGCGGGPEPPALSEDSTDGSAPPPPAGWIVVEGPTPYNADSLFEYLNGGAPLYLKYGFQGLTQTRYQLGDDPFASVTLDIYDMGSELGAFGVYRSILPPGVDVEDWGVEGYLTGTVAAAWRGSVYIHGEADDDRPELVDVLGHVVSSAVEAVAGQDALPAVLEVLPHESLVPGSERYVAADLFGHAFLPGGVVASYDIDGVEAQLFFSELADAAKAAEALERLRRHQEEWGDVGAEITDLGEGGFRFVDPGLGAGMVVRAGDVVAGVHGPTDADHLVHELLMNLRE